MVYTKRIFNPGSEWVYYKIYTGPKTADLLLTSLIKPIVNELYKNKLIEKWFFIRYSDPKFHLRVRFKVINISDVGEIISVFNTMSTPFIEEGFIWKTQLDTYQKEIERYGIEVMSASETLFYYNSEMIVSLFDLIDDNNEGEEIRWLFGIRLIDNFLNDFCLSEPDKLRMIEQLKIGYCAEFNMNRFLKKQLDKKYISNKNKIRQIIELDVDDASELAHLINLIHKKKGLSGSVINNIKNLIDPENLNVYLGNQIHMTMNRLFRTKNRLSEMVIYYFLYKHYKASVDKRKYLLITRVKQ